MPFFQYKDVDFYYRDSGEGRPLLFLHGLGGDQSGIVDMLNGLKGIRLITMDFRGHGRTHYEGEAAAYQIGQFTEDAKALLDHLEIKKAVVGGISLGAAVSLCLSIQHPDLVSGLIMVRPAWLSEPFPYNLDLLVRLGHNVGRFGVEKARAILLQEKEYLDMKERIPGCADALLGQLRKIQILSNYEAFKRLPGSVPYRKASDLMELQIPVIILTSIKDPLHPLNYGRDMAKLIKRCKLIKTAPRYLEPDKYQKDVRNEVQRFVLHGI